MLDTLRITLHKPHFSIELSKANYWTPSIKVLRNPEFSLGKNRYFSWKQNPTKAEIKDGIYRPRLTLTARQKYFNSQQLSLSIEFSAPKLIYGNNFDEVSDSDLPYVVQKLHTHLENMGVITTPADILQSNVSAIHYSKNLELEGNTSCSMILNKIRQADVMELLDVSESQFRNGGQMLKYHSASGEIVFYDKLRDLEQTKKSPRRSIDKDGAMQLPLFTHGLPKNLEILRLEVRLGTRSKIRQILTRAGIEEVNLTLQSLFQWKVSQRVLLSIWQEIDKKIFIDFDAHQKQSELLELLIRENPSLKPRKALLFTAYLAIAQKKGSRYLKHTLGYIGKRSRSWTNLKQEIGQLNLPRGPTDYYLTKQINDLIKSFRPTRLKKDELADATTNSSRAYLDH